VDIYQKKKHTHKSKISYALKEKYQFKGEEDYQCKECQGFRSTWVYLDLDTKTREWKTGRYSGDIFCGMAKCKLALSDCNKRGLALRKKKKEEKLKAKQDALAELQRAIATYNKREATPKNDIPEAFRTSYDYTGDFQCSHCSGYWSTWVKFDLTSGKRKWMTPGTAYADDMWFCGLAKCLASCKAEENRRRAAKTATQVPSRSKRKALASIQQPQAQAKKKKSSQRCQLSKENKSTPQRKRVNKKIQKENKAPASNQGHKQGRTSTGQSRRFTKRRKRSSNSQ
jgi:hypothetical protein